ncbi:hypothetical protein PoB_006511100 [Plakobranchus ocellatus]|uniref:Uncharacterized protein n=1 Tax=Plakobranchus ocellatus TaxID=259542 RepID=A0AAV4D343_9GAST|nr:hypothetical protein PoB_006511100 [Plakobranchus ocellatus]
MTKSKDEDPSLYSKQEPTVPDWLEACRAFAVLGMIAGLISVVADIVLVVFSLAGRDGSVVLINVVSLVAAVASFPDWLEACRAFALLGMIAGLISVVADIILVVFSLAGRDGSVVLINVASLAAAVASCVMIIICIIIFAAKAETSSADFGYSFVLSIVGGILIFFGGGLSFLVNKE